VTILRALFVFALTTTGFTACASANKQATSQPSSRNRLTREQLAGANTANLYDAISKVRPEWLSSRGPTSVTNSTPTSVDVFMNGSMLGKAEYLKEIGVIDVTEVRYWDAASASARFGMGHPRGVIEVSRN
jgi:hypothetical protein